MNPHVTEVTMNMGFEWNQMHNSLRSKNYDSMVATYLVLSTKKPKMKLCTIMASPFLFPHLSIHSFYPTMAVQLEFSATFPPQ